MSKRNAAKEWILQFIIKYSICPYAKPAFDRNQYKIVDSELIRFEDNLFLATEDSECNELHTYLIVIKEDISLDQALELLDYTEDWLELYQINEEFQTVLFHPDYLHANIKEQSPIHFTNRSPNTIIQLITQKAIKTFHNPEKTQEILDHNQKILEKIGFKELEKSLHAIKGEN